MSIRYRFPALSTAPLLFPSLVRPLKCLRCNIRITQRSFGVPISYTAPFQKQFFRLPIFRKLSIPAVSHAQRILCLQAVEELPPKLQNIVKLFEAVQEPRAKYEQLLHYGKKLNPLGKEFQTMENKVEGCVSQVWVRAILDGNKVFYEADSDSVLTKGLAALLVEGLSGCSPADILKVSPDFIQMLGLKQSLTPSRNNGFLNMLKLMQKKALQLYMEAESGGSMKAVNAHSQGVNGVDALPPNDQPEEKSNVWLEKKEMDLGGSDVLSTRADKIRQKLETTLEPMVLEIEDISNQHAGHAAMQGEAKETHFNVKIVSDKFKDRSLVKRHRLVYELLEEELQSGLHALSIVAKTPAELESI
eukprot:Gb_12172 [translate_table: standard]